MKPHGGYLGRVPLPETEAFLDGLRDGRYRMLASILERQSGGSWAPWPIPRYPGWEHAAWMARTAREFAMWMEFVDDYPEVTVVRSFYEEPLDHRIKR